MSRHLRTLLLAATAACLLGACGVPRDEVRPIAPDELPAALREPTTTAADPLEAPQAEELADVAVFWISDKLLVPEAITFESAPDVERVMTLLERGPDNTGRASEVRSAVSQPGVVRSVARTDTLATVELSDAFSDTAGSNQVLALGQIVATLTSVPGVTQVEFLRSGEALEIPVPDGELVRRPVTRSDYASLLSEAPSRR